MAVSVLIILTLNQINFHEIVYDNYIFHPKTQNFSNTKNTSISNQKDKQKMNVRQGSRCSVQNQSNISDHIVGQWLLGLKRPRQLPPGASGCSFGGSKSANRCPQ